MIIAVDQAIARELFALSSGIDFVVRSEICDDTRLKQISPEGIDYPLLEPPVYLLAREEVLIIHNFLHSLGALPPSAGVGSLVEPFRINQNTRKGRKFLAEQHCIRSKPRCYVLPSDSRAHGQSRVQQSQKRKSPVALRAEGTKSCMVRSHFWVYTSCYLQKAVFACRLHVLTLSPRK